MGSGHCLAMLAVSFTLIGTPRSWGAQLPPGLSIRAIVEPDKAPAGTVVDLAITIEVPEGWISFDLDQVPNSAMPTRITLDRSPDFAPFEGYSGPRVMEARDPMFNNRIVRFFPSSPTFHRQILVTAGTQAGEREITGRVDLQLHDPATGKHYLIRQHPFRTTLTIQKDSALGAKNAVPSIDSHKPIVADPSIDEVPASAPAVVAPLVAAERPRSNEPVSVSLGGEIEPEPSDSDAPSRDDTSVANAVSAKNTTIAESATPVRFKESAANELDDVPGREPIIFEIGPSDLRLPFGNTLGDGTGPVFDWHALENSGETPLAWILIVGFLLGGFAAGIRRDYVDWRRGMIEDSAGLAVGVLAGVPSLILGSFAADAGQGILAIAVASWTHAAAIRSKLKDRNDATTASPPLGSLTWPIAVGGISLVVGALLDRHWGPLFVMLGFAVGFVAGSIARVTRMSMARNHVEVFHQIGPPGLDQVFAMILVALAMLLLGRADRADGDSDWIGYRFVLASWAAMAFLATVQFLLPWPESAGKLNRSPLRLTLAIGSLALTFLFASHLIAPPMPAPSGPVTPAPISDAPAPTSDTKDVARQASAVSPMPGSIQ